MLRTSLAQALDVYSDLVLAWADRRSAGGVAEIYAYRLLPDDPTRCTGVRPEQDEADARYAAESLATLCGVLMEKLGCETTIKADEDWLPVREWLERGGRLLHRAHVRVRAADREEAKLSDALRAVSSTLAEVVGERGDSQIVDAAREAKEIADKALGREP